MISTFSSIEDLHLVVVFGGEEGWNVHPFFFFAGVSFALNTVDLLWIGFGGHNGHMELVFMSLGY